MIDLETAVFLAPSIVRLLRLTVWERTTPNHAEPPGWDPLELYGGSTYPGLPINQVGHF